MWVGQQASDGGWRGGNFCACARRRPGPDEPQLWMGGNLCACARRTLYLPSTRLRRWGKWRQIGSVGKTTKAVGSLLGRSRTSDSWRIPRASWFARPVLLLITPYIVNMIRVAVKHIALQPPCVVHMWMQADLNCWSPVFPSFSCTLRQCKDRL